MKNLTRFFLGLTFSSFLLSASAQTDIDTLVFDGLNRLYEFHVPASHDGSEEIHWCLICMAVEVIPINSEFILKWMALRILTTS